MTGSCENRNVFVTGCTGLLGSHLIEVLVDQHANVVGLVMDLAPLKGNYERSEQILSFWG